MTQKHLFSLEEPVLISLPGTDFHNQVAWINRIFGDFRQVTVFYALYNHRGNLHRLFNANELSSLRHLNHLKRRTS